MANTRGSSPYSTYHTDRIQLIGNPELRNTQGGNDQQFVNCYPSIIESPINGSKRYRLEQRGGLKYQSTVTAGEGRGIYYYDTHIFSIVANKLYKDGVQIQVLSTSTGPAGFVEYASITNKYLVVLDGTSGWCVAKTTGVVTQITDVDFPTPHNVKAAFLDGYLLVSKANTDDIYNCVLNDPFTWNAGDFISAEMYPDDIVALVRQNNYIVAIGENSMEYFYDSGVSPGTPLARNSAAAHTIGTPAAGSVVATEEQIIFLGQTGVGGKTIWIMDGFQPTEIGIDPVKKQLNAVTASGEIALTKAFCIRTGGHRMYVLMLRNIYTWVYDFDTKMWHQWADFRGDPVQTPFLCGHACDSPLGSPYMLGRTNGFVYLFQYGVPIDYTGVSTYDNITCTAISAKLDFGNMNQKMMSRFSVVADRPYNIPPPVATCTLYWSDDDYQTWSSGRSVDLTTTMPTLTQLGIFRRRGFKLVYACDSILLIEGFEIDTNMGSQ